MPATRPEGVGVVAEAPVRAVTTREIAALTHSRLLASGVRLGAPPIERALSAGLKGLGRYLGAGSAGA